MRTLSSTLLSAQKASTRTPAVRLRASNLLNGVVNLKWERLYSGTEADRPHALTLPGDGSLIRLYITPIADGNRLQRQRVTGPGPGSDFSTWTYLDGDVMGCAACSLGTEVSLFWAKTSKQIVHSQSPDCGVSWTLTDYPGTVPVGNLYQMAAAYKPGGDLALFFTDTENLYVIRRVSGVWQARAVWDKSSGLLLGAAAVYDKDWKLLVSGQDSSNNFKIWSLVYGDGGDVPAGTWTDLKEIASAPSDAAYSFNHIFLDRPDTFRCFYTEKYTGTQSYQRPFYTHNHPAAGFIDSCWREPVPFETESQYGLALAHYGDYAWLSCPSGVWRAALKPQSLDLSNDIIASDLRLQAKSGELTVELDNSTGKYSYPGDGEFSILETGCRIDFNPGCRTSSGTEYSDGLSFSLQRYEHTSAPGRSSLVLYAFDGWVSLERWTARSQFRWNPSPGGTPVIEILSRVLARAGLNLQVVSSSAVINGFYPDFTIHPGDNGKTAIERLLSFVPDVLFLEGDTAYLINPPAADTAVYSYGADHAILEGRYRTGDGEINRVRVEGTGVTADSFDWEEIARQGDLLEMVEDINITTAAEAVDRGSAHLRKAAMEPSGGYLRAPVNCGQQLYDVIEITDPQAGLSAARWRVRQIYLNYSPRRGVYEQKLGLGKV